MKLFLKIGTYAFVVLVCFEIALQIYNPFAGRVKNGQIVLPVNTRYTLDIPARQGMDTHIVHSKNSLGFRGPEPNDSAKTRILCMGGSTTECFYLNDGKDWPAVLGKHLAEQNPEIWLNNAGMDGQSTFGHLQMLRQYILKLKPDYIILMCGLNDMGLDTPGRFDNQHSWFSKAYQFLELPSTILNITRAGKARRTGLNHQFTGDLRKAEKLEMSDSAIAGRLQKEARYLGEYNARINEFADICRDNNIRLIFVSQSILFSDETDLMSNVYLGNLKTGEINGKTRAYILKLYNKATYDLAISREIPYINLAARLPKDSRFFYDGYHFTIDGAEMAAEIIYDEIKSKKLILTLQNGTNSQ